MGILVEFVEPYAPSRLAGNLLAIIGRDGGDVVLQLELLELFANPLAVLVQILVALTLQDAFEHALHEAGLDVGTLLFDVGVHFLVGDLDLPVLDFALNELTADDLLDDVLAHVLDRALGRVLGGLVRRGGLLDGSLHAALSRVVRTGLHELGPIGIVGEPVVRAHVLDGGGDGLLGDVASVVSRREGFSASGETRAGDDRHRDGGKSQTSSFQQGHVVLLIEKSSAEKGTILSKGYITFRNKTDERGRCVTCHALHCTSHV